MATHMVSVGEESGSIDTMLDKVSHFYEQEVGAIVGSLSVSPYLPMFNLIKLIK